MPQPGKRAAPVLQLLAGTAAEASRAGGGGAHPGRRRAGSGQISTWARSVL